MADYTVYIQSKLMIEKQAEYDDAKSKFLSNYKEYYATGDAGAIWSCWEQNMSEIQDSYLCAGRRLLLEWFFDVVHGCSKEGTEPFRANVEKLKSGKVLKALSTPRKEIEYKQYRFRADMTGARDMESDNQKEFCSLLRDLADGPGDKKENLALIKNAFYSTPSKPLLTKADAFALGHLLGFSLETMSNFLFRVFQDGAGGNGNQKEDEANLFCLKKSRDIIEYFCFLFRSEGHSPQRLTDAYLSRCGSIEKAPFDPELVSNITLEISHAIDKAPLDWKSEDCTAEEREALFLSWLEKRAPCLDVPSHSATVLVRLLARKILQYIQRNRVPFDISLSADYPLLDGVLPSTMVALPEIVMDELSSRVLQRESWTEDLWIALSEDLKKLLSHFENNEAPFEDEKNEKHRPIDSSALFTFFTPRRDRGSGRIGEWTKLQGGNRLQGILSGVIPPCKNDVLLLLFTLGNIIWNSEFNKNVRPAEQLQLKLSHFDSACSTLLNGSRFPAIGKYYQPHYTEFSIFSSMIFSAATDDYYYPLHWFLLLITSHDRRRAPARQHP